MKKISSFLLVTLFLSVTAFAQERSNDALPQNGIKLNVSSLMFSHLAFQYERVIGRKMTVCMGLRIRPNMKFGNSNTFQNQNTNANDVLFTDVRYGSLAFTPEFRYYFKEAMRGFYVAPYLRYRNTPFEIGFQYRDDNGYLQRDQFSGNINAFMGGVMIGTNVYLSNQFSLDIFIIGAHASSTRFSLDWLSNQPLTPTEQADFVDSFEEIKNDLPNIKLDYRVSASGVTTDSKFGGIGFRGAGLNFVYKF